MLQSVYADKYICASYSMKPLNALKQVLIMFVALEKKNYFKSARTKIIFVTERKPRYATKYSSLYVYVKFDSIEKCTIVVKFGWYC